MISQLPPEVADTGRGAVLFRWPHGGHSCYVTGSFNDWGEPIELIHETDAFNRGRLFSKTVNLPAGRHTFQFLVDGVARHDTTIESEEGGVAADGKARGRVNIVQVTAASHGDQPPKKAPKSAWAMLRSLEQHRDAVLQRDYTNSAKEYNIETLRQTTPSLLDGTHPTGPMPPRPGTLTKQMSEADSAAFRELEASAAVGATLVSASVKRDGKLFVCMVGAPARGKTYLARSIKRHLDWVGLKSEVFNVVEYRRKMVGVWKPSDFFDPSGEGEKIREEVAAKALDEALASLAEEVDIVVYDAANHTRKRRKWICKKVAETGLHCKVIFIEAICTNEAYITANIKEHKRSSPEYADMPEKEAMADFRQRIRHYESKYESLTTSEKVHFIKVVNGGEQIATNRVSGYIPGRIMLLVANLQVQPRTIWMSRHGESEFNMEGRIGGDSPLTSAGQFYAQKLCEYMRKVEGKDLTVWTSTMLRTGMTVSHLSKHFEVIKWRALDEINAGLMDGLTYEHVAEHMPVEYEARKNDKLHYRYPRGESYEDVFARLEPVMFELLNYKGGPLLIVGHQAILRVLYGYLMSKPTEECPALSMPLHTVIKLTPRAYSCEEEWFLPLEELDETDKKSPTSN